MNTIAFLSRASMAAILLGFCAQARAQTTWYVDVNGVPPGNGTAGAPYTSIQYGITRPTTVSGDTLLVAPGTYVENLVDYPKRISVTASGGPLVTELRPLVPAAATVYWTEASTIEGFTLTGNTSANVNGGALNLAFGKAVRCVVRNNSGWGVYSAIATLQSCTIIDNGLGIFVEFFSTVDMLNTIVWGNNLSQGGMGTYASYCAGVIPPASFGTGNLIGDPALWPTTGARFRLRPGSPCIDAGDPALPLDPDGTRADIGAIPYDATFAPTPTTYCVGKSNSQGCVPVIGSIGTASLSSGAPFTITAAGEVDNKPGLLLFSLASAAQTFQGGMLCVQSPIKRLGSQNSNGAGPCTGTYAFDMGAYLSSAAPTGLLPGAFAYCQWWNRDPLDPAGFGSGLSNGLSFGVAP